MWYGFYGETLSSGGAFAARIGALCREIGGRGRVDASFPAVAGAVARIGNSSSETALRAELRSLKVTQLKKRAHAAGVDPHAIEESDDADVPKESLIELIAARLEQQQQQQQRQQQQEEEQEEEEEQQQQEGGGGTRA
jgi:hypothetical protein